MPIRFVAKGMLLFSHGPIGFIDLILSAQIHAQGVFLRQIARFLTMTHRARLRSNIPNKALE